MPESAFKIAPNWLYIARMTDVQFADMTSSSSFFDVAVFLLSGLVTGPSFMAISLLAIEL